MGRKDRDLEMVNRFLEETHYQCNEATRDFIAKRYPTKLLDDIWNLIAYEGQTEDAAILQVEANLKENKIKWEGEKPFSGFVALEIAKNWIKDTDSEQWRYPEKNISEHLDRLFQYAIEISAINRSTLKLLINKYKSNWDVVVGEILSLSLHIRHYHSQANRQVSTINKFFKNLLTHSHPIDKMHQHLCDLALEYYDSERNKFLLWVKEEHPNDYVSHELKNQFSYLIVLIKNIGRNNANYVFSEQEWISASHECKSKMLVGWADRRQSALEIAKYHVVESEEDKLINRAQEVVEDAEEMLEAAHLYAEYVKAIASGATGLSLPPIIRIKGKRYDRDVHPSVVIIEAEKWFFEAQNELEELRSKYANTST